MLSPEAAQRAVLLAGGGLVMMAFWICREWLKGPQTIPEKDEALARERRAAMRGCGRLRVSEKRKPEWAKRLRRKWMASGRLGDQKLAKVNQSEANGR